MKKIITFLLLVFTTVTFSQSKTVTGIIKDATSSLPIESVSISISNSSLGTISNEEGKFRIILPESKSTLEFSHLYYTIERYAVKANDTEIEIFLTPKSFVLEEVVINGKPGKELLSDALAASKAKLEKSIVLNTYYREFVNVDGKYTSFSEGLIDYYVKRKSGASDIEVKQSRVFDLKDENATEREKAIQSMNLNDVRETVTDAYNFKIVGYLLKSDYYYFGVETKTEANGNSIEVITIEPKENLEQPMLYEGSVTYDAKTKLILDIDLKFSEAHKKYNKIMNIVIAKVKFNNYVRKTTFKLEGDKYILLYGRIKVNAYIKFGKKINNTLESSYDVTTLDYKEGEFKLDKDKKYRVSSLFKNGNKYTEEFWKKYNVVLLSDAEEKIIKSLK